MAEVKPFRGIRYQLSRADDLGQLISPPYDMLDDKAIDRLYDNAPHNIVRIIQNRPEPTDTANRDRHVRAADVFNQWQKQGVLLTDTELSFYVYRQEFAADGRSSPVVRTGLIAKVKLVDFSEGVVFPHEYTLPKARGDRYEHLCEVRANTEQIFGIVADNGEMLKIIDDAHLSSPDGTFTDGDGVRHSLYGISAPNVIGQLVESIRPRTILIADGHHRYEAALAYSKANPDPANGFIMMTLVSMADPGLVIRPFHRLLRKRAELPRGNFRKELSRFFSLGEGVRADFSAVSAFLNTTGGPDMLCLDSATGLLYPASLNQEGERFVAENSRGMSSDWNHLGVSKVRSVVVGGVLGIPYESDAVHDILEFEKDPLAVLNKGVGDDYYGAFLLKPVTIGTVKTIAAQGERMPQKSTNFFPKCYSGLVLSRLE